MSAFTDVRLELLAVVADHAIPPGLLRDVQRIIGASADPLSVTVSVGVSTYPEDGPEAEELVRRADTAMYQAKATGRDRVVATSP